MSQDLNFDGLRNSFYAEFTYYRCIKITSRISKIGIHSAVFCCRRFGIVIIMRLCLLAVMATKRPCKSDKGNRLHRRNKSPKCGDESVQKTVDGYKI
jgi:hypothetical protein